MEKLKLNADQSEELLENIQNMLTTMVNANFCRIAEDVIDEANSEGTAEVPVTAKVTINATQGGEIEVTGEIAWRPSAPKKDKNFDPIEMHVKQLTFDGFKNGS